MLPVVLSSSRSQHLNIFCFHHVGTCLLTVILEKENFSHILDLECIVENLITYGDWESCFFFFFSFWCLVSLKLQVKRYCISARSSQNHKPKVSESGERRKLPTKNTLPGIVVLQKEVSQASEVWRSSLRLALWEILKGLQAFLLLTSKGKYINSEYSNVVLVVGESPNSSMKVAR